MIALLLILSSLSVMIAGACYCISNDKSVLLFSSIVGVALVLAFSSIPFGVREAEENQFKKDQATYAAWQKHTGNLNKLSFEEWRALNDNYVPRTKYQRRNAESETE